MESVNQLFQMETVKYKMTVSDTPFGSWEEDISLGGKIPANDGQAIEMAQQEVKYFNDSIRPHERERRLVDVRKIITQEVVLMDTES